MNRFWRGSILIFVAFYMALVAGCAQQTLPSTRAAAQAQPGASGKWEADIEAFEKQDQRNPPPAHPILFVGSSTIRFWKVSDAFPGLPVLNRGFGGSETSDVLYYFDRVVARYHPST